MRPPSPTRRPRLQRVLRDPKITRRLLRPNLRHQLQSPLLHLRRPRSQTTTTPVIRHQTDSSIAPLRADEDPRYLSDHPKVNWHFRWDLLLMSAMVRPPGPGPARARLGTEPGHAQRHVHDTSL